MLGSATEPAAHTLQDGLFLALANSLAAALQGAQARSATAVPGAVTRNPSGQSVKSEQPMSLVGEHSPVLKPLEQAGEQGRHTRFAPAVCMSDV